MFLAEDRHVLVDAEVGHAGSELLAGYESREFGGGSQQAVALGWQVGDGLVAFLGYEGPAGTAFLDGVVPSRLELHAVAGGLQPSYPGGAGGEEATVVEVGYLLLAGQVVEQPGTEVPD